MPETARINPRPTLTDTRMSARTVGQAFMLAATRMSVRTVGAIINRPSQGYAEHK